MILSNKETKILEELVNTSGYSEDYINKFLNRDSLPDIDIDVSIDTQRNIKASCKNK